MSSVNNNNNNGATPAVQVNHRNRGITARVVDPNRMMAMMNLQEHSSNNLGSQKGSQQQHQQQTSQANTAENTNNNNNIKSVPQSAIPTVLTLAGVRRILCNMTEGGQHSLEQIVVLPDQTSGEGNNSNNCKPTVVSSNARPSDLTVGTLIEGCEPGLRSALEMCWLRVGRNTRKFITEVQSCSEASLLQRGRIHFGFEVGMDTLVCHLAPTLAVRLEMLPTTVLGVMAPATTTTTGNSTPVVGKILTSNGASPVTATSSVPIPPAARTAGAGGGAAVVASKSGGEDQNDDDDDNNVNDTSTTSAGTNSTSSASTTSAGNSSNRSALRRQRNHHEQQQQQQPLDHSADGAALFSPLKGQMMMMSNVVGSSAPIGISRVVEDKVWLDTADLFCDALAMMGAGHRAVAMGVVLEAMAGCPVLCEVYSTMMSNSSKSQMTLGATPLNTTQQPLSRKASSSNVVAAGGAKLGTEVPALVDEDSCPGLETSSSTQGQQQQQQHINNLMGTPNASPFASFHTAASLQADTAAALAARSSLARSSTASGASSSSVASLIFDAATVTPNEQLRAVFRAALTAPDPRQAEAARQSLIDVLRSVSATTTTTAATSGTSAPSQPHSLLPRWTDGMPHNNGSATFIRELIASEQRTPHVDYFANGMQPSLTSDMRIVLVDWLHAICTRLKMSDATFHLNVALLDRALTLERDVGTRQLQLLGIAAMVIASKYCEIAPPPVSSFVYMSANAYSSEDILQSERVLFNLLDAYVTMPSTLEAADLVLAEQSPAATNEQRAYVHFLLHAHLHFNIYGGEGHVIDAARAAVFLSRIEFGMDLESEKMMAAATASSEQQLPGADGTKPIITTTTTGMTAAATVRRPSITSSTRSSVGGNSNSNNNNRASSHLPHWHVDSCFLSESEARMCNEMLTCVNALRDPSRKATDLVQRYSAAKYFGVSTLPFEMQMNEGEAEKDIKAKVAAAVEMGARFRALHTPRTPDSSTGSSPASAKSVRGD